MIGLSRTAKVDASPMPSLAVINPSDRSYRLKHNSYKAAKAFHRFLR